MTGEDLSGLGQAVEPERGEVGAALAGDGHFDEAACRNCGAAIAGAYCSSCGQKAHLHRTLTAFWHDLVHGALHVDGKMWRTLPLLVWKPGELTRRYIDGERARFVSPMALFLFSVFLMFAVFSAIGLTTPTQVNTGAMVASGIDALRDDARADLATLEAQFARSKNPAERADLRVRIVEERKIISAMADARDKASSQGGGGFTFSEETDWTLLKKLNDKWRENPGLMLYKLQANSYKFGWLLIPLSVPFMWLLFFWKGRYKAYDHAIFVTYSIAFMSLLFVAISLLVKAGVPENLWGSILVLVPPIHIYRQLRGAYRLRRRSALWRLGVLAVFIAIIATLFLQLLVVLGAF